MYTQICIGTSNFWIKYSSYSVIFSQVDGVSRGCIIGPCHSLLIVIQHLKNWGKQFWQTATSEVGTGSNSEKDLQQQQQQQDVVVKSIQYSNCKETEEANYTKPGEKEEKWKLPPQKYKKN